MTLAARAEAEELMDAPGLDAGTYAAVLRDLARVRNPVYALAPVRVESNHTPHDTTVRALLEALGR